MAGQFRRFEVASDVALWPIATNSSLGLDVSLWGEAEVGRAAKFAASVENDPQATLAIGQPQLHVQKQIRHISAPRCPFGVR